MLNVSILSAFFAGLISFVSPCVLPLIPAYLSFISGISLDEMRAQTDKWKAVKKTSLSSLLFIFGFSLVFIILGASATFVGAFLRSHFSFFSKIAGIVIVVFGLHLLGVFKIPWFYYEKRFHAKGRPLGVLAPFMLGFVFAFGWTPCVGPILAGVLLLASNQDTVLKGMILLAFYSAGLGIPFFVAGVGFNLFLGLFEKLKKCFRVIEIVSGVFLIVIGVLIFFSSVGFISDFLYGLMDKSSAPSP